MGSDDGEDALVNPDSRVAQYRRCHCASSAVSDRSQTGRSLHGRRSLASRSGSENRVFEFERKWLRSALTLRFRILILLEN
jgi:hypothetical protein